MIPQLLIIGLGLIGAGSSIAQHGTTKTETNNCFTNIMYMGILWIILYYGGFWDVLTK